MSEREEPPQAVIADQPIAPSRAQSRSEQPAAVYLASLAPGSRRTMRAALNTIAALLTDGKRDAFALPWGEVRYQHTQAVRTLLMERYAAATANKMLAALRRVLKEAWRLKHIGSDDYQAAIDLKPISGEESEPAAGRSLDAKELTRLLQTCARDPGPAGVRDSALIAIAYACGLRRAEIVAIDLADYDNVKHTLRIKGKRNKRRIVPLAPGAVAALSAWLRVRGYAAGPLFVRILKGDHLTPKRLTPQAVYYIEARRGSEAGVDAFSPHDLRRTFAGDLLDAGVDIATVQKLMGHANTNTTARYDRRGERAKRQAVGRLSVPFGVGVDELVD